jgi:hypothetical protein
LCHILNKHGDNPANLLGMSFKEPIPALSNVMDTNEHASSHNTLWRVLRMWQSA